MDSILAKQLLFVSGKGGVGKTTVSLCLGILAAEQGRRCLLVEIDTTGVIASKFDLELPDLGVPLKLRANLWTMVIEGRAALDEYLGLIMPSAVLRPIINSKVYEYFVAGAPGLKALMSMGKILYEVERTEGDRPAWDLVIVDAPATGHGLEYFRMPQAAYDTFTVGRVHRETERVIKLLRDSSLTLHLIVTLAEELPVSETFQLYQALSDELGFPLGAIVVNRFHPDALPPPTDSQLEGFRCDLAPEFEDHPLLCDLLEQADFLKQQHAQNARCRDQLQNGLDVSLITLPAVFEQRLRGPALTPLIRSLDEQIHALATPPPVPSGSRMRLKHE